LLEYMRCYLDGLCSVKYAWGWADKVKWTLQNHPVAKTAAATNGSKRLKTYA
jgi:hypothetical protein